MRNERLATCSTLRQALGQPSDTAPLGCRPVPPGSYWLSGFVLAAMFLLSPMSTRTPSAGMHGLAWYTMFKLRRMHYLRYKTAGAVAQPSFLHATTMTPAHCTTFTIYYHRDDCVRLFSWLTLVASEILKVFRSPLWRLMRPELGPRHSRRHRPELESGISGLPRASIGWFRYDQHNATKPCMAPF